MSQKNKQTNLELKKEKSGKRNVLSVAPNSAHSGHGYFSSKDNNLSRQEGKGRVRTAQFETGLRHFGLQYPAHSTL